tara:strand:- start:296 stop:472 length:177 start_codon:yes stop_codon:yes gene_type:complete
MRTTGKKPNLTLDKIHGIRADKNNGTRTQIPVKQEETLQETILKKRATSRVKKDGYQY